MPHVESLHFANLVVFDLRLLFGIKPFADFFHIGNRLFEITVFQFNSNRFSPHRNRPVYLTAYSHERR